MPPSIRPYTEWEAFTRDKYLLNSRYSFVRSLQSGSFGSVCLAYDSYTNTNVSLKALLKLDSCDTRLGECSNTELARREIKALTLLTDKHDDDDDNNICQMIDNFESSAYIYLVLEFCANGDLYDLIEERNLTMTEILKLSQQLGKAVLYSHSQGVYHRDIKPENIVIDSAGDFKLCDWGLASFCRQSEEFDVGTDRYMAPECFLRAPGGGYMVNEYDCVYADYWSVGITMLVAIFGRAPFRAPKRGDPTLGIKDDTNFRNFVLYNIPLVLYDIYPCMNKNCFDIIMTLLRCGSKDDDTETAKLRLALRDLRAFIRKLELGWTHKLLMDDEEYEEEEEEEEEENSTYLQSKASVFEMDHDDLVVDRFSSMNLDNQEYECDSADTEPLDIPHKYPGTPVPINGNAEPATEYASDWLTMQLPSLIESSIGSSGLWCDWVDLDAMSFAEGDHGGSGLPCNSPPSAKSTIHKPSFERLGESGELDLTTDWLGC